MNKKHYSVLATVALVATFVIAGLVFTSGAQALESRSFPAGTTVVPMDGAHQNDKLQAFGLIHAVLSNNINVYRIIEPPDVTLKTNINPGGVTYAGGPFLIEGDISVVDPSTNWSAVTTHTLSETFNSNQVFTINQPTNILVIDGYQDWADTEIVLGWMGIPYDLKTTSEVEADPNVLLNYNLVVDDCGGWDDYYQPGNLPDDVKNAMYNFVQNGGEIIFTDRSFGDLDTIFPGYVNVVTNSDGVWNFNIHNLAEFPAQYEGPSSLGIYTMGGGLIVDQALDSSVRTILDSTSYGGGNVYRIGGFYFPFGSGIVEGFAYHPEEQTTSGDVQVLSAVLYGNKFVHGVPPVEPPDEYIGPCCVNSPPQYPHSDPWNPDDYNYEGRVDNEGNFIPPDEGAVAKTLPLDIDVVHSLYLNTYYKVGFPVEDPEGSGQYRPVGESEYLQLQKDELDLGNVTPLDSSYDRGGIDGIDLLINSNDEWIKDVSWTGLSGIPGDDAYGWSIPASQILVVLDNVAVTQNPYRSAVHTEHESVENIWVKFAPAWCNHAGKYQGTMTVSATQI